VIGPLVEVDCIFRVPYVHPLQPWSWFDNLATGGGLLNSGATHVFAMLERMLERKLVRVAGQARVQRQRAPIATPIHDFRHLSNRIPTEVEAAIMQWRTCDADDALSALLEFGAPDNSRPMIPVTILINLCAPAPAATNGWHFYGEHGTLFGDGVFSLTISQKDAAATDATPLPVPQKYVDALPQIGDDVQNKWVALAHDFVADIRGEPHRPYLTFHDGWRYQEAIDAIRSGGGWYELPVLT
jgi:predicted dehydrogenase